MMTKKKNWTNWFEIPVSDFDRAKTFYETIFDTKLEVNDFGTFKPGIFPQKEVGCAICTGEHYHPSADGPLVYPDAWPDLKIVEGRIEKAGGKVITEKRQISPDHGHMAIFFDTEGNRLCLWSKN